MICNVGLVKKFRASIHETTLFSKSKENKNINLICAIIDRLDTCVNFINKEKKLDEDNLVLTIVYIDLIKQCIKKLINIFEIENPYEKSSSCFSMTDINGATVSDDDFFRYMRSLTFAHSVGADQHKNYLLKDEVHYSPWISLSSLSNKEAICLRVYSSINQNSWESINDIRIPLDNLYKYLNERFELLELIINKVEEIIKEYKEEWKKHIVIYDNTHIIDVINELIDVCEERYENCSLNGDSLKDIKKYMLCHISNKKNYEIVNAYRFAIAKSLQEVCEITNRINDEDFNDCEIYKLLCPGKQKVRSEYAYNLEKIFCYLDEQHGVEDVQWALKLLRQLNDSFLSKYIILDENLSYDEIHLLINAALYHDEKII